jgi:hypothetical protein
MHIAKEISMPSAIGDTRRHMLSVSDEVYETLIREIREAYLLDIKAHIGKFLSAHSFVANDDGEWKMWEEDGGLKFVATFRTDDISYITLSAQVESSSDSNGDYAGWPTDFKCLWQRLVAEVWILPPSPASYLTMERLEEIMQVNGYYSPSELLNGIEVPTTLKYDTIDDILTHYGMEKVDDGEWANEGSAESDWYVAVVHNDGNMAEKENCYVVKAITCHKEALTKAQELINLLRQFEA